MTDAQKSNVKPIVWGGLVAVLIGIGIFLAMPTPQIADSAAPVAETATEVAPVSEPAPVVEAVEETAPEPNPEVATIAPETPTPPAGPQFDTFRVDPDGSMVIAGRAEPEQVVDIILGGEAIERVRSDGTGSFVALARARPSPSPRRLSLLADPEGAAIPSDTSYIVAPIAAPAVVADPAAAAAETTELSQATAPAVIPQAPAIATRAPAPPTVLESDADGIRIVQGGPDVPSDNVVLDAITYDPAGEVQLAGRAIGDGAVQVYIDNEPVTASPVTRGGDWQIALPQIDTGVYTLRIDEVDSEGDVISRLETPFKREEPADVAAVLAEETEAEGFEVAVKTVQPGATLWAIAEENLGRGIYYIEIFAANADLIRDPDLIYPGQIFRIPEIIE
ncbi:LysM peptidoglycan-binding domain-containing protein [Yoonia sp.]|uniref:LysM peptidoglycan-binding domain-containing protein n=1 Tax=Yoonia sp. TaxID=2212373 RepID=UPI0023B69821